MEAHQCADCVGVADPDLQLPVTMACSRVSDQLGINRDALRGWVKQAEIDAGIKPGVPTDDQRRPVDLERPLGGDIGKHWRDLRVAVRRVTV
jgi:transposase-like protein